MPKRRRKSFDDGAFEPPKGPKKVSDYVSVRRTANEVKKFAIWTKAASVTALCMVGVVAVTYLGSFLYDQFGAFSVKVNKYDMVSQGLSLSENGEFLAPTSRLTADGVQEITNISGDSIPPDVGNTSGSNNGANYIAYTFFLKNVGEETVTYNYNVVLSNITLGLDRAIRVRVYQNGTATDYARMKTDGTGPERGTKPFPAAELACQEQRQSFAKNDVDRFTVVIWLEGDDPDCVDEIIGGQLKLEMRFSIVESA